MKITHYLLLMIGATISLIHPTSSFAQAAYQRFLNDPNAETAFNYMHQVATHPRCSNCHGVVDDSGRFFPTVGEDRQPHPMGITIANNVVLVKEDEVFKQVAGVVLSCRSCHQDTNGDKPGMPPGNTTEHMPGFIWHMPQQNMTIPAEISPAELCEKWLDPAHNSSHLAFRGGRDDFDTFKKEFHQHHATLDPLVAWSWQPGPGREKAPGQREDFIRAVGVWVEAGAPCPE